MGDPLAPKPGPQEATFQTRRCSGHQWALDSESRKNPQGIGLFSVDTPSQGTGSVEERSRTSLLLYTNRAGLGTQGCAERRERQMELS